LIINGAVESVNTLVSPKYYSWTRSLHAIGLTFLSLNNMTLGMAQDNKRFNLFPAMFKTHPKPNLALERKLPSPRWERELWTFRSSTIYLKKECGIMRKMFLVAVISVLIISGCGAPEVKLFTDSTDPLQEFTLEGKTKEKILIIPIRGLISTAPDEGFLSTRPSLVQEVVSQLKRAKDDKNIKAIILQIDSLGGTVTASDILYHEIKRLKEEKEIIIVAVLMDLATSGGYYIALPANLIIAHPTTVTGSVGVVFIRPDLTELMNKIGLRVNVCKSGEKKDMGTFYRDSSPEENELFQNLVDKMGKRFVDLVSEHRNIDNQGLSHVASAKIMLADEAEKLGLIDRTGYINDALDETKKLAGLPDNTKIVVYRRSNYPDDNYYNPITMKSSGKALYMINLGIDNKATLLAPGFYYLWLQGNP
jgi:protease-4